LVFEEGKDSLEQDERTTKKKQGDKKKNTIAGLAPGYFFGYKAA
jgi:hypothetical protein